MSNITLPSVTIDIDINDPLRMPEEKKDNSIRRFIKVLHNFIYGFKWCSTKERQYRTVDKKMFNKYQFKEIHHITFGHYIIINLINITSYINQEIIYKQFKPELSNLVKLMLSIPGNRIPPKLPFPLKHRQKNSYSSQDNDSRIRATGFSNVGWQNE